MFSFPLLPKSRRDVLEGSFAAFGKSEDLSELQMCLTAWDSVFY